MHVVYVYGTFYLFQSARWVQCRGPGLRYIPANAPADTVRLRLENTLVSRVPRAAFYNLSQLRFLWLTYNCITSVHPSSFLNLRSLHELRLDGNLLSAFPWEGLRDAPLLRTLGLHNNRLSSLPAQAALFLPNVTYLDLSSNRLTMLPAELLNLWFPRTGREGGLVKIKILGLHDNPWLCNCEISMIRSLSMSRGSLVVLIDQMLTCSKSIDGPTVEVPGKETSHCIRLSVKPAATTVISSLGSNVILRCDATGFPTPTLTWIKTSTYSGCCPPDTPENIEPLPKNLKSFLQVSPGVGLRWSVISLSGLSLRDAGEYRCQARNTAGIAEANIKLKVVGVIGGAHPTTNKLVQAQLKTSFKLYRPDTI
ncbi:leucine-rich repeat, immunoglobulin-like domain and transmembrane domain-containing protein 3b [Gadus morhua]|uniref:leucine-rich repeat, immunoglobulin-like domain and transmembrane domain-containing protein 3b n=1 Tax=Gadus morhua TaxID=8049 RepID=UPI0011B48291|nr:leucine-rich repeat, immunoglobulin-like domain and transmembrane domain-containing protein 3 [Gadus morhua]